MCTTTDQTPDAVRAAIAEAVRYAFQKHGHMVIFADHEDHVQHLTEMMANTAASDPRLAQLGALRPVGSVTISRETARRAHSALVYLRVAKDEMQDDDEQRAEKELASALANGADDGGALRPVGVTFSLEEANIIQDALRHGTSVDEALAMLDERVARHLPDAAARAGDALRVVGDGEGDVDAEVEECWTDFWLPLVAPDGVVDLAQIKRELFDYHNFMGNAAEVFCHVTDGRISKINTDAAAVISVADECANRWVAEALAEAAEESADAAARAGDAATG